MIDPVKRLGIELSGIEKVIQSFAKNTSATNAITQLYDKINNCDEDGIKYCVKTIIDWYDSHMEVIQNKPYARKNLEKHQRNLAVLREIQKDLNQYDFARATAVTPCPGFVHTPLVFISHRSSDKKYGDALAEFITGLGVKRDQLIYTSSPLHKIPLDKNIYEFLRENIHRKMFMIILWSEEYLDSPACLNEMGAAWVVQCDYTNIYTPTFSFGNPKYHQCAVDTRKMGAVLKNDDHCRAAMIELKNKILELFDLGNDEIKNSVLLNNFMQQISAE